MAELPTLRTVVVSDEEDERLPLPLPPTPPAQEPPRQNPAFPPVSSEEEFDTRLLNSDPWQRQTVRMQRAIARPGEGQPPAPEEPRRRFEDLPNDPRLLEDLRAEYRNPIATPRELVDRFVQDRVWRDVNTVSAGREFLDARSRDPEALARLGRLRTAWSELPSLGAEGGRGIPGLIQNVVPAVLDPVNLAGGVIGKLAGRVAGRALPRLAEIGLGAGVDAGANAGFDAIQQATDIETGTREGYDPWRTLMAAGIGGVTGGGTAALFARRGANAAPPLNESVRVLEEGMARTSEETSNALLGAFGQRQQQLFDRWLSVGQLQQRVTGVGREPQDLMTATRTIRDAPGGGPDPAQLPYFQFRNLTASWDRAHQIMTEGGMRPPQLGARLGDEATDYTRTSEPSFMQVLQPVAERGQLSNAFWYLAAIRARFIRDVRNPARDTPIQTPFDNQQIYVDAGFDPATARMLSQRSIDDIIQEGDRNGFNNLLNQWNSAMHGLLEYQREAGVLSHVDVQRIWGEHLANPQNIPNTYIPFYRAMDQAPGGVTREGSIQSGFIPGRASMEGGTGMVQPWIDSLTDYVTSAVTAADRNIAKRSLYDMIANGQATGALGRDEIAQRVNMGHNAVVARLLDPQNRPKLEELLRTEGINTPADQLPRDELLRLAGLMNMQVDGATDIVFRNGRAEYWKVTDPGLLDSLRSFGPIELNRAFQIGAGVNRIRNNFITLNPAYIFRNSFRDAQTAPVNSVAGIRPIIDSIRGFDAALRNQELVREAYRNGMGHVNQGHVARDISMLTDATNRSGDPVQRAYGNFLQVLNNNYFAKGVEGMRQWSDRVESAHRMAEYILARRSGMSGPGAAFLGREVATDFSMSGSSPLVRGYSTQTGFFNAGIQSFYKLGRTLRANPGKTAAFTIAGLTLPDLAIHYMNAGHPDYEDIPSTIRSMNVFLPVPTSMRDFMAWKLGGQTEFQHSDGQTRAYPEVQHWIMVPKAYDYGAPGTLLNGLYDWLRTNNAQKGADALVNAFVMATPSLNTPWWATAPYQLATGRDWMGRNIVPRDQQDILADFQGDFRTTELARQTSRVLEQWTQPLRSAVDSSATGRGVEVSPFHIDYMLNYFAPGVAQIPISIVNDGMREVAGRYGARPERRADEASMVNPLEWFVHGQRRAAPLRSSEAVNRLMEISNRAQEITRTNDAFLNGQDLFRAFNLGERPSGPEIDAALRFAPNLQEAAQSVRLLGESARTIEIHPNMSAADKRRQIDTILQRRNEIARATLLNLRRSPEADPLLGSLLNPHPSRNLPAAPPGNASPPPAFLQPGR